MCRCSARPGWLANIRMTTSPTLCSDRLRGARVSAAPIIRRGLRMPRPAALSPITELNERSREIFRVIVDGYVATGETDRLAHVIAAPRAEFVAGDDPKRHGRPEEAGLLYAPHTSAGRLPTELGLRLFVHGLLEVGRLAEDERRSIESLCLARGKSLPQALEEATTARVGPVALRRDRRRPPTRIVR